MKKINICKNMISDKPTLLRKSIESTKKITFDILKYNFSAAEKSLLIDCYTLAETMFTNTKYELLNYDESSNSNINLYLKKHLKTDRYAPNVKIEEINKFFKRYNESTLLFKNLPIYDRMIDSRHEYAHKGVFNFETTKIPKLIEILKYFEFEYRMLAQGNKYWYKLSRNLDQNLQKFDGIDKTTIQNIVSLCNDNDIIEKDKIIFILKSAKDIQGYKKEVEKLRESIKNDYF